MKKDNRVFLKHILERINRIEVYLLNMNKKDFQHDMKTIDAVVRNIEVIGEAATNLSREFFEENPHVKWRKIIATRNQLIHGYAAIDVEITWDISQNDLPILKKQIEEMLENLS